MLFFYLTVMNGWMTDHLPPPPRNTKHQTKGGGERSRLLFVLFNHYRPWNIYQENIMAQNSQAASILQLLIGRVTAISAFLPDHQDGCQASTSIMLPQHFSSFLPLPSSMIDNDIFTNSFQNIPSSSSSSNSHIITHHTIIIHVSSNDTNNNVRDNVTRSFSPWPSVCCFNRPHPPIPPSPRSTQSTQSTPVAPLFFFRLFLSFCSHLPSNLLRIHYHNGSPTRNQPSLEQSPFQPQFQSIHILTRHTLPCYHHLIIPSSLINVNKQDNITPLTQVPYLQHTYLLTYTTNLQKISTKISLPITLTARPPLRPITPPKKPKTNSHFGILHLRPLYLCF